jgi:zinc transport system permease protein
MINTLLEMFSYAFLVRAVIVGLLVALCAALLGVSLVLKRYSMIGDGLSHVGFGSLAIATAMNLAPLTISIPVCVLAAFLLLRISESGRIKGDAAIALISTGAIAIGVVVISLTTGLNTDVCNYLFGSILAMNKGDVKLSIALAAAVLVLFAFFYNKIFAVTFDENFAKATGVKIGAYNMIIAFLTAITIVLGMRMMGALLISSLIIFPALTSMRLCKWWKSVTVCSAAVSVLCFFAGVVISYVYATPTGASVVIINIIAFLLFWAVNEVKGRIKKMKKLIAPLACLALLLSACAKPSAGEAARNGNGSIAVNIQGEIPKPADLSDEVFEIREKMFVAQMNDIYINPADYLGKTIKYEGLFKNYTWERNGETYYYVIRYGPGCCGTDGDCGLEIVWDGEYPAVDDWVECVGVLEEYEELGATYLRLGLTSLTVLDVRGAEYVEQ